MAMSRPDHDRRYERNRNVLVVGGSGSGKTPGFFEPNVMQMSANYLVTDPKGESLPRLWHMLKAAGYKVLSFNAVDFSKSLHYNPIAYIQDEADILEFVTSLIDNTTGDREHAGDPFWENAERLLYVALIGYLVYHCPKADRSLSGLVMLLSLAKAKEAVLPVPLFWLATAVVLHGMVHAPPSAVSRIGRLDGASPKVRIVLYFATILKAHWKSRGFSKS